MVAIGERERQIMEYGRRSGRHGKRGKQASGNFRERERHKESIFQFLWGLENFVWT